MNNVRSIFSKEQVRLVGHINRLREFPSVTIGIFQRGDKFFAVWQSTDVKMITDVHSEADLLPVKNYHHLTAPHEVKPGTDMVFAFTAQDLVVGTITEVKQQIARRLDRSDISEQEESILRTYLIIDS